MGHPMGGVEDFMTIIMGLPGPMAPGMHGKIEQPDCVQPAVEFATKIRDMAEEFLHEFGKCEGESCEVGDKPDDKPDFKDKMNDKEDKQDDEQGWK